MTDWNLSDTRVRDNEDLTEGFYVYPEEDVKEFIRRLKDSIEREIKEAEKFNTSASIQSRYVYTMVLSLIDKLAGEKLL